MNDLELERTAADASAWLRTEAERVADTDAALAACRAGGPTAWSATDRRYPRWVALASAAAVVALLVGIAAVSRIRSNPPAVQTPPSASLPLVSDGPEPSSTNPVPPESGTTVVGDAVGPPVERRVLATYTEGDGVGQLGFEECEECEPYRPWAPVVTTDGSVIVADSYNRRWQIYRDEAWDEVPYRDGEIVVGSPVIGPDGLVYALVADSLAGTTSTVASFEPADLTVVSDLGAAPPAYSSVDLVNGVIRVGDTEITDLGVPLGTATWERDAQTNAMTVALSGLQRTFQLPDGWMVDPDGVVALDDGSIVAYVTAPSSDPARTVDTLLLRMWADGRYGTGAVQALPATTSFDVRFTDNGMIQLERDAIVEYAYPRAGAGVDNASSPTPTTIQADGPIDLAADYFGARNADDGVAIDRFGPDGEVRETLSTASVAQLRQIAPLADGSIVRLDGEPVQGRCFNRPLLVVDGPNPGPLSGDLGEARSVGVSPQGVVVATRDVCPNGTRWGDDGTKHELVMFDPAAPDAGVQVLMTRESERDLIVFDDGANVIAMGELAVAGISPDGRYVAVSDLLNPEDLRWHVIDTLDPGAPLDMASSCARNGDIIGPPRFLDGDVVVIARLCAAADSLPSAPQQGIGEGETQIDAVDLGGGDTGTVIWRADTAGLLPDSYSRTVQLSATTGADGDISVFVTANGGVEDPPDSYLLRGDQRVNVTRSGWYAFAFQPVDLL